jgi:hypothetical protein
MPVGNWNLEWLNHNAQRAYPLADDATGPDETGAFKLPDNFLVELDLPVHAGLNVGPAGFFVLPSAAYAGGYGSSSATSRPTTRTRSPWPPPSSPARGSPEHRVRPGRGATSRTPSARS